MATDENPVLRVDGEVAAPRSFAWSELAALPEQVSDVGAVVSGREGGGVLLRAILAEVRVKPGADFVTLASSDGKFSISVPLSALHESLIAYRLGEGMLPEKKGGPMRFLIPNAERCGVEGVDACANVKGLGSITLTVGKDPRANHRH